nr:hypothetical protein [Tanacetum cinerariifolium]
MVNRKWLNDSKCVRSPLAYKKVIIGLESVEARLVVYKQNESILEENIQLLKVEVQARDTALVSLRQNLNQAEQERDDLKLKFDKFQTSSQSLTELLASQKHDKQAPQIAHSSIQSNKQVTHPRHSVQHVEAPIPAATPKPTTPKTNRS